MGNWVCFLFLFSQKRNASRGQQEILVSKKSLEPPPPPPQVLLLADHMLQTQRGVLRKVALTA